MPAFTAPEMKSGSNLTQINKWCTVASSINLSSELDLIQHSAQTDNMLCINSHIIHVSMLQTSVCWQEKEDFVVGPLGFLDKNGESETLPSLSGESG